MKDRFWQLPSNSGRYTARWQVVDVVGSGNGAVYACDVTLAGEYYLDTLGTLSDLEPRDHRLGVSGLPLRAVELYRLLPQLNPWLALPLAEQRRTSLELTCTLGERFNSVELRLRRQDGNDLGHHSATFAFEVGTMSGELSYLVDQSCLRILAEGIEDVLEAFATRH